MPLKNGTSRGMEIANFQGRKFKDSLLFLRDRALLPPSPGGALFSPLRGQSLLVLFQMALFVFLPASAPTRLISPQFFGDGLLAT